MATITAKDGHEFDCWVKEPTGSCRGNILIIQEIFGVTDQLKELAEQYISLGFRVAIPALFDRIERNAVVPFNDAERARSLMGQSTLDSNLADLAATIAWLEKQACAVTSTSGSSAESNSVCAMGFCWGGGLAVCCAQKLPVKAAIAFYATRMNEYLDAPLAAPVLAHFGSNDSHVPAELLAKVKTTFPDMTVHEYEAGHAFANHARDAYVTDAATLAHQRNMEFLDELFPSRIK